MKKNLLVLIVSVLLGAFALSPAFAGDVTVKLSLLTRGATKTRRLVQSVVVAPQNTEVRWRSECRWTNVTLKKGRTPSIYEGTPRIKTGTIVIGEGGVWSSKYLLAFYWWKKSLAVRCTASLEVSGRKQILRFAHVVNRRKARKAIRALRQTARRLSRLLRGQVHPLARRRTKHRRKRRRIRRRK